jgi:FixJ family two-component response regulator
MTDIPSTVIHPRLVALVDDDDSVRQATGRLLKSSGYAVETFASADDFLRRQGPEQPGCLVLDVQMPGLSGLELQKVVMLMRKPIPIVFITAHHDEAVRRQAVEGGCVGFLEKPFDDEALIALIQKSMEPNASAA